MHGHTKNVYLFIQHVCGRIVAYDTSVCVSLPSFAAFTRYIIIFIAYR